MRSASQHAVHIDQVVGYFRLNLTPQEACSPLPHYPGVAIYRLKCPPAAFTADEKHAFRIPTGSLVKKDNYIPAIGLTDLGWARKTVTVAVQDFVACIELFGETTG
jgi:hypothetical protein